ncbi:uncharacterized protein TNCV_4002391 [Trichonephila clavipes]|uniref:Uncharacterized protein n=1 Tax=Trichonephila clavipes TaxID=2585209 RepID=A0A8X6RQI6_TRICX|nr:uncharacterized protein TNCV_4002391 [Trichonephila clavipes]
MNQRTDRILGLLLSQSYKYYSKFFVVTYVKISLSLLRAVGSLVVRTPDSGPEGLGSMPVLPNTFRVHTEYVLVKSVGPKVLWAESRVQKTGENFPSLQFHAFHAAPSIVMFYRPFVNFTELNCNVTCMVLKAKANDRLTSSPLP